MMIKNRHTTRCLKKPCKMKIISFITLWCVLGSPLIADAYKWKYCPVITDQGQFKQHQKWQSSMGKLNSILGNEQYVEIKSGMAVEAAQKEITGILTKTSEGYISAISAAWKQHAIAISAHTNQVDYSPYAKSAYACFAREESIGIAQGGVFANEQYVDLLETTQAFSKQTDTIKARQKLYEKLADPEESEIENSGRLFPFDNQIGEEEAGQIAETIIIATDPLPYPILIDEYQKNVPAGLKFMATKKVKDLHVSIAQQALADIISKKLAVYDMKDWSKKVSLLLADQLPESRLSADQILDIQVGSRYSDPNRTVRIHQLTQTGVYRELVAGKAVNLELSRRILRHAEKEVFMTASAETLSTNVETLPDLMEVYQYNIGHAYGD